MEEEIIKKFIEKVKLESGYNKIMEPDFIEMLIDIFSIEIERKEYTVKERNPLEIALAFYKDYNLDYYNMIIEGISNKKIIICKDLQRSFCNTVSNITTIKLRDNDGDIFMLVHEFAHFIDRNSKPFIIPDNYWYFGEVFSFYMERNLEGWLDKQKYGELIETRNNNRKFYEKRMLKTVKDQMYYEDLYNDKGAISEEDLDIEKIKIIMSYNSSNLINYLLGYPLANIISEYLVTNQLVKNDKKIIEICLSINLYEVLKSCLENKVR